MPTRALALPPALLAVASAALLSACGADDSEPGQRGPEVVATTTQVADLTRNVAGDRARVRGLLAPNSDPHDYEPRPSDVRAVAESKLVLRSGGDLDVWAEELTKDAGGKRPVVDLSGSVETVKEEHAEKEVDPHWWQDPRNAVTAVGAIRDRLSAADPAGRDAYRKNAASYVARLRKLDREIARCMAAVPARQRKLVTTHDALAYFAERYDVEVVGAAIPALTTQAQPSAGETARLVSLIREEGVKAVFPERGLNRQLERAIAEQADATVGGELWADALGPKGSSGETYLAATAHNAKTMAKGFTGGETPCEVKTGA